MSIVEISPVDVYEKISKGDPLQLVDVRELPERNAAKIEKSVHLPLSQLTAQVNSLDKKKDVYLICRSGHRAAAAAKQLEAQGLKSIYVVKGGIDAWVRNGLPIDGQFSHIWSLERQVRFTAGLMILIGIGLSYAINANWIFLSVFAALGMVVSAIMNTCGMATMLKAMPWNCQHSR